MSGTGETRKFTNKISTTNLIVISFMICDFVTKPINKTKIVRCEVGEIHLPKKVLFPNLDITNKLKSHLKFTRPKLILILSDKKRFFFLTFNQFPTKINNFRATS